jgi:hypothetical protein
MTNQHVRTNATSNVMKVTMNMMTMTTMNANSPSLLSSANSSSTNMMTMMMIQSTILLNADSPSLHPTVNPPSSATLVPPPGKVSILVFHGQRPKKVQYCINN